MWEQSTRIASRVNKQQIYINTEKTGYVLKNKEKWGIIKSRSKKEEEDNAQ